jgi:hypothetical protein
MMFAQSDSIANWKAAMAQNRESMAEMTRRLRGQAAQIAAGGRVLRARGGRRMNRSDWRRFAGQILGMGRRADRIGGGSRAGERSVNP